ncbi:MAG TPA: glycosyltransferase [Acidimicrobiales bacterium]
MVPIPRRAATEDFPFDVFAARSESATLVVPALDEAEAIANVVAAGVRACEAGVLDEVVVADGGSSDRTADNARSAGARVVRTWEVFSESGPVLGKGDTMWRALGVIDSDVVAFMDADLEGDLDAVIRGLVGPLVVTTDAEPVPDSAGNGKGIDLDLGPDPLDAGTSSRVEFVKGSFHRIAPDGADAADPFDGGRVTELMARPLLNLWRPQLSGFYQPLSGQVAGRRGLLRSLPMLTGYAVEIGMLLDVVERVGFGAVLEVDLGTLSNRPRTSEALAQMAQEVLYGFSRRVLPSGARPRWRPYWRPDEVEYPAANIVERPPIDPFGAEQFLPFLPSSKPEKTESGL